MELNGGNEVISVSFVEGGNFYKQGGLLSLWTCFDQKKGNRNLYSGLAHSTINLVDHIVPRLLWHGV